MTRTARAAYPRAILKDRSESRSGLDNSIRKHGAGQHNWGSINDEHTLEVDAMDDEHLEEGAELRDDLSISTESAVPSDAKPEVSRRTSNTSDDELEKARQFRKHAFKKTNELDLSAIARTSVAVVRSPTSPDKITRRPSSDNTQIQVTA